MSINNQLFHKQFRRRKSEEPVSVCVHRAGNRLLMEWRKIS